MKKIIAIILAVSSLFFLTVSKSLADWSVGVTITHGAFEAGGSETEDGEKNTATTEEAAFTFGSVFMEHNMGIVSIGLDYIPGSVDTEEQARTDYNQSTPGESGNDGGTTSVTNKASVSVSGHISLYALVPITDIGAFVRFAAMKADIETKESLGTGSTYPDATMKGIASSIGYQHEFGAGFVRAEVGYSDYETVVVTSSNGHKVEADVDGRWGRISIGRTF